MYAAHTGVDNRGPFIGPIVCQGADVGGGIRTIALPCGALRYLQHDTEPIPAGSHGARGAPAVLRLRRLFRQRR